LGEILKKNNKFSNPIGRLQSINMENKVHNNKTNVGINIQIKENYTCSKLIVEFVLCCIFSVNLILRIFINNWLSIQVSVFFLFAGSKIETKITRQIYFWRGNDRPFFFGPVPYKRLTILLL